MYESYATLQEIRWHSEATYTSPATLAALDYEDVRLQAIAREITSLIESPEYAGMPFMPTIETRYFDALDPDIISKDGLILSLDCPIVSLTSATLADGTSLTVDTDVFIRNANDYKPSFELRIERSNTYNWWLYGSNDWKDGIAITGIWCYRSYYTRQAWQDSGQTVQDNPMSSTTNTLTVTNSDALSTLTLLPIFSVGNLIRIDSEYMVVMNHDTALNTLTVERGVRGSTAAAHTNDTQIDVFQVEPQIVKAAALATAYRYARIGKYQQVTYSGDSDQRESYPSVFPDIVMKILKNHSYRKAKVV